MVLRLHKAQNKLGYLFHAGDGVVKDRQKAFHWFILAAKQGNPNSQSWFSASYEEGIGALKDTVTAHMWYNIAAANGQEIADEFRDAIETSMTPEQIAQATERAKTCLSTNYADCDECDLGPNKHPRKTPPQTAFAHFSDRFIKMPLDAPDFHCYIASSIPA